jgi:hypothetical protein
MPVRKTHSRVPADPARFSRSGNRLNAGKEFHLAQHDSYSCQPYAGFAYYSATAFLAMKTDYWMGGVSIISGTLLSVSGTISNLNNHVLYA